LIFYNLSLTAALSSTGVHCRYAIRLVCRKIASYFCTQLCLNLFQTEFVAIATKLSAVVACRCSPTQKADVARLIRKYTKKRVCCIGDGGNDVSMIQAADVGQSHLLPTLTSSSDTELGIGLVGKEGNQASLSSDFSLNQFSHLTPLLLWHGRLSYTRSAKLAQFVIHRGLIISVMQAVFSAIFYFSPIALYQGWLMVGYATVYTMAPVFSLVLDRDVSRENALLYPELYKELTKVSLSVFGFEPVVPPRIFFRVCLWNHITGTLVIIQDLL
jgi:phospholipid-translocating ATPase